MSSQDGDSGSSRQASLAESPASSYLSAPSSLGRRQGRDERTSAPPTPKYGQGYVSPYPPLQSQPAAGRAQATSRGAQSGQSALLSSQDESQLLQKQALIQALNDHRMNTLGELRRVERLFASLGSPDLTQPMTAAWMYYVNSNSLLTELRSLTRNYPFSSECLDDAKRRVYEDPASNRSWNYCWLVLAKIHTDRLIPAYAQAQASRTEMWGGKTPRQESVQQLAAAFVQEWSAALAQLLRCWETPPIRSNS